MAKKPNYSQERTQRARVRELRQQEKQQRREEASLKRKGVREGQSTTDEIPE